MTHKSTPLHSAAPTVIPADFWINRPVGYTTDGFPLYPSFAKAPAPTPKAPAYKPLKTVDLEFLADLLIMLATDYVEDDRGYCVDVSDILALFDGAVGFDIVDYWTSAKCSEGFERTLAGWVPNADLNNAHNIDAFQRALSAGATDWNGANADGHPVDVDGLYDADNAGFFDKFGCADTFGFSECDESFFTHNDCGEDDWD